MKSPVSLFTTTRALQQKRALEILRNRMFRGARHSKDEIHQAVTIIREYDPEHPLLRYSERGRISETSSGSR